LAAIGSLQATAGRLVQPLEQASYDAWIKQYRPDENSANVVAYRRFSGERGYTPADFRAVANEVGGADLGEFFHRALETTGELDYAEMLDWYGLRFNPPAPDARAKAWLGVVTRVDDGRLLVSGLLRGTPAYGSGLTSDDELIAIDDFRLDMDGLDARVEQYQPGAKVICSSLAAASSDVSG
jgi:predicted metalloprotease with PDZ domain